MTDPITVAALLSPEIVASLITAVCEAHAGNVRLIERWFDELTDEQQKEIASMIFDHFVWLHEVRGRVLDLLQMKPTA